MQVDHELVLAIKDVQGLEYDLFGYKEKTIVFVSNGESREFASVDRYVADDIHRIFAHEAAPIDLKANLNRKVEEASRLSRR